MMATKDGCSNRRRSRGAMVILLAALMTVAVIGPFTRAETTGGGEPYYYFQGSGRAHGVGLCMDGVKYRALAGQSCRDIINHYYTAVSFGQVDDNQPIRVKCRDGQVRTYTLHDYLYHLAEEPEDFPFEGLKVLYLAARTYALSCIARGKHASDGYDICSSGSCCQAFDENKELSKFPNNCAAVDATTGEVILHDGKIITAAYCGSCGGHSENNEDVWGGSAIPYLRGKPDDFCSQSPRFGWSYTFSRSELEARLNSREDTFVGTLHSIDLTERTPGGRVRNARLAGSAGHRCVSGQTLASVLGFPSTKFDLLNSNFDEYILVLNPNPQSAHVTYTFMRPDGGLSSCVREVPPCSRSTLKVNDYMQFQEVSTRVSSDVPVASERTMYFDFLGSLSAGSCSAGVVEPATLWYMAEGYTGETFDTYVCIQNPEPETAYLAVTFILPGGDEMYLPVEVGPCSRTTLHVDDIPGLENTEVSTKVESVSDTPVIAERSCYFDYNGKKGGHNAMGVTSPRERWYFAEGYTGGSFDTYILLMNPDDRDALVKALFMKEDGSTIEKSYQLEGHSRKTVHVDAIGGLEDASFSTRLSALSGADFIAERAMYFDYAGVGICDGHDSTGMPETSPLWYLAEGYTGGCFDTYVLIMNPGRQEANLLVTFSKPDGDFVQQQYRVPSRSRKTIWVDAVVGLSDTEFSTTVLCSNDTEVVVERAVYFVYSNGYCSRAGGHSSCGISDLSTTWFFAEGYTGF